MLSAMSRAFVVGRLATALIAFGALVCSARPARAAGSATPAPPAVIYMWYADGGPAPSESACAGKTPPGYTCTFGADVDSCKRQVQDYLDRWYADLNVVFTHTRPTEGQYFTVVVTSAGGDWCNPKYDQRVGGVAPISCQQVLGNGTCYAFQCGHDAKTCATIIAQEQAHLVGLEHTASPADAMYVYVSGTSDGFENREDPIAGTVCNRITQNSFQSMRLHLGAWQGGPKPDPFLDIVKGTLPVSAYPGELQGSAYGCALAAGGAAAPAPAPLLALAFSFVVWALRIRRRDRRRARR